MERKWGIVLKCLLNVESFFALAGQRLSFDYLKIVIGVLSPQHDMLFCYIKSQ